jgi:KDO2-lipid IV(A) lauroyltransferase
MSVQKSKWRKPPDLEDNEEKFLKIFSKSLVKIFINLIMKLKLSILLHKIPKSVIYFLSSGAAWVIFSPYQNDMLKTTKKVMGDIIDKKYKNRDEEYKNWVVNELVYQNGIQMTELFLDVITHLPYFSLYKDFEKFFEVSGLQNLDKALEKGKGVVLLTGHIGNYLFLCSFFALKGYKVNFILEYATFRDILDVLRNVGIKLIPAPRPENENLKQKIKEKIKSCLLNNEIIVIMQDAGMKHHSLVEFFGEACHSPLGGAYYAIKYESPIIPAFIKSFPQKHLHKIRIYPEFELEKNGLQDEQEIIFYNTLRLNKFLEREIKRNFIYWNNLAIFHIRKIFKKTKIFQGKNILDSLIKEIQFYKNYIKYSYEINRDDKVLIELLNNIDNKLKKIKENK